MDRINHELNRTLRRLGSEGSMPELVGMWPGAVGPAIARNAWPARVARDGTLHVATSSAAWAFELGLLAETILARLREALGERAPARLRFAPGKLPEPAAEEPERERRTPPAPPAEARRKAAELSGTIEDEELRELVTRAAAASLASAGNDRRLW